MPYEYYGEMRPLAHQLKTIKFMLKNKRGYLFLSMGTGKTATTLWFIDMLLEAGHIKKVLISAPLSTMKSVWADEVRKVCPYRKYVIVHGTRNERIAALNSNASIFITNTDAVRTYEKEFIKLGADVLILDEVTDYANATSKRSRAMQRLSARTKSVFGLSGGPVAGGLINSFGIAKVVNPSNLPTPYFTKYRDMILQQINMYEYIEKPGALGIVNKTLSPAIKFSLEECVDLPPLTFETRVVELPEVTMNLFKDMLKHQIAEFHSGVITAATAGVKAIRLMQILTGSTKTEEGTIVRTDITPKLMELLSIYHEAGNKLVVFAQSVETVRILEEFFISKKIHVKKIHGDVSLNARSAIVQEFQSRPDGVLVAQVKTMSHGITLTKSHTLVFFGTIAGNETYRQAIRRIRRIGQEHPQTIVKLISTKFEEKVFAKLDATEFTSQAVLEMYGNGFSDFI
jgi:SNF2 family DNA or RNA helicase